MSYDIPEVSVADAEPYFLYQFSDTAGTTYLTSEPESIVRESQVWIPESISHSNVQITGNVEKNDLVMEVPLSSEFGQLLLLPATSIMTLTIFRGHHSDLTDELRPIWKGRVVGARSGKQTIRIVTESIYTSLRRTGCTARVQRSCRHALYLPGCNLDKDLFAIPATITAISGLTLTVPEAEGSGIVDGQFKAGMFDFNGNWGFINYHVGTTIKIISEVPTLEDEFEVASPPILNITLYPGCDRSEDICHSRFDNILNYGGFKRRPKKNPFSGSVV